MKKINNEKIEQNEEKVISREEKLFLHTPIWKILLKMSIPGIIIMLIFGLYTFVDNVLAVNFANDYSDYEAIAKVTPYSSKDLVRLFMAGVSPVTTFMLAITLLFGVGVSRRYSINIGLGKEERAIKTAKTTMMFGLGVSVLLIPVLMLTAKPWMQSQFDGDPAMAKIITDQGWEYIWIIIITFPIQLFNQVSSSLLRAEARNKQMLIATLLPILINLLFDWILMGPCGMGIDGGAWATLISYVITAMMISAYMLTIKGTRATFKNLFGIRGFQWITLVGVVLVGLAPFLRNMAQSITQTLEMSTIQDVSKHVYGNPMQMSVIMTAVFPIFGLFFPMMFGIIQASSPITAFNYGAKNMDRVRQATWYTALYSTIIGVLIFVLSTFAFIGPLTSMLGISNEKLHIIVPTTDVSGITTEFKKHGVNVLNKIAYPYKPGFSLMTFNQDFDTIGKAQIMYGIMMSSILLFGPALGAMSLLGSTDRIALNVFASSLRGIILLIPFLYSFAAIAVNMDTDWVLNITQNNGIFSSEYFFWWFYPALAVTTATILVIVAIVVMKNLDKKHTPLEERIQKVHEWATTRRESKRKGKSI